MSTANSNLISGSERVEPYSTASGDLRTAQELRNRAFWALSALDREVCKRGRHRFREEPRRRADFAAYATDTSRAKKPAKPAVATDAAPK